MTIKKRNKHLNDFLMSRKSGAHEDIAGIKTAKRERQKKDFERQIRESEDESNWHDWEDE